MAASTDFANPTRDDALCIRDRRILVIEDQLIMALDTAQALEDAGAEVIGPSVNEQEAWAVLAKQRPDAAVLDLNLGEGATFSLAKFMKANHIPFMFCTGYDPKVIPEEFSHIARLEKPMKHPDLVATVAKLLREA